VTGRVVLTGKGLVSAICGEYSVFVIDGSEGGAMGNIRVVA